MKPLFEPKKRSALEAQYEAQKIAYAPIIFQAVRAMRDLGILEQLDKAASKASMHRALQIIRGLACTEWRPSSKADSTLYIMETCWDRQQHEAAAYSLINTSPYFTCMASGNSKMYSAEELIKYVEEAGLRVRKIHDHLGICHTLFECVL